MEQNNVPNHQSDDDIASLSNYYITKLFIQSREAEEYPPAERGSSSAHFAECLQHHPVVTCQRWEKQWEKQKEKQVTIVDTTYGGVHKWGYPKMIKWLVYKGKSYKNNWTWMIWGYPYFRKPLYVYFKHWETHGPTFLFTWGHHMFQCSGLTTPLLLDRATRNP